VGRTSKRKVYKKAGTDTEPIHIIENERFVFAYEPVESLKSVSFGIWFPMGSRFENENNSGISHFIEHMIFKGTRKYRSEQISEIFDELGARVNAFTGREMTCFYAHLLSEHLEDAVSLLFHMLKEPAFRKKDIESERSVILQEISMYEDSPDDQIHDYFAMAAFNRSQLGKPIIGTRETVSSMEKEELVSFYRSNYLNNRFVIAAAGNLNPEIFLKLAETLDGNSRDIEPAAAVIQEEPGFYVEKKDTAQTHLCFGFRIFGSGHPDRFSMAVLDNLLGGMMSSRLFKEIRERRGLAYSTYSYHTYFKEAGFICAYAGTAHEKAEETLRIIREEFRKLVEEPVSDDELRKAKENAKSALVLSQESMRARMMSLGKSLLSKEEVLSISEIVERIDEVTGEDIQRLAETYFTKPPVLAAISSVSEEILLRAAGITA
jgi:predicted Zn-dependent peptidase